MQGGQYRHLLSALERDVAHPYSPWPWRVQDAAGAAPHLAYQILIHRHGRMHSQLELAKTPTMEMLSSKHCERVPKRYTGKWWADMGSTCPPRQRILGF